MSQVDEVKRSDFYHVVRAQLDQENGLLLQKFNWFIWGQSFLVSAYAIVINAPKEASNEVFARQQHLMAAAIPISAFITTALTYAGILSSIVYMRSLTRMFYEAPLQSDPVSHLLPPIEGQCKLHWLGDVPTVFLPLGALILWALIFFY